MLAAADAGAPAPRVVEALPPLPAPPRFELSKPGSAELEEVDRLVSALDSPNAEARDAAARELLEAKPRLVPAIAFRLHQIADNADKEALKRLFSQIRDQARGAAREAKKAGLSEEADQTPDYLTMLLNHRPAESKAYPNLLRVIGLSRMLTHIGTVEAVRVLIDVYVRFGEFLRIHTQRELSSLGERAVPALLEARRHPAEKIGTWARRQLDALGRAVPSEAVQTADHAVLADVLRAYGRLKDPDAARIIVSFANSERAKIREAARQAVVLMGEVSIWQLRDSYETTVGKRPPRDWSWERMARELFGEFDRMRSAAVLKAYDAGRAAHARGDLEAMRAAYDDVLAKDPMFERREELSKAYWGYAESVMDDRPALAKDALFRAARLSDGEAQKRKIDSLLLTLRAKEETSKGLADVTLLTRAIEQDPENQRAQEALSKLRRGEPDDTSARARKLAASSIALGALAALFVLLRRRSPKEPASAAELDIAKPATNAEPATDIAQPAIDATSSSSKSAQE